MQAVAGRGEELLRERAFLALLLLVGVGAIGIGLDQIYRTNSSSLSAAFDLGLGASVLLVTWLFLAPAAIPAFFGDPRPGELPMVRPYLSPVLTTPTPAPKLPSRSSSPTHVIPKWADPLVHPRVSETARPAPIPSARRAAGTMAEIPVQKREEVPEPADPTFDRTEDDGFDRGTRSPRATRLRMGAGASNEMIEELDRIEAELRAFIPLEIDAATAPAAPSNTYDDLID